MELLRVVYRQYRWPFLAVMALTMASAGLGIGIIAFINQYLMDVSGNPLAVLPTQPIDEVMAQCGQRQL